MVKTNDQGEEFAAAVALLFVFDQRMHKNPQIILGQVAKVAEEVIL